MARTSLSALRRLVVGELGKGQAGGVLLGAEAEQLLAPFLGCGVYSVCWPAALARGSSRAPSGVRPRTRWHRSRWTELKGVVEVHAAAILRPRGGWPNAARGRRGRRPPPPRWRPSKNNNRQSTPGRTPTPGRQLITFCEQVSPSPRGTANIRHRPPQAAAGTSAPGTQSNALAPRQGITADQSRADVDVVACDRGTATPGSTLV